LYASPDRFKSYAPGASSSHACSDASDSYVVADVNNTSEAVATDAVDAVEDAEDSEAERSVSPVLSFVNTTRHCFLLLAHAYSKFYCMTAVAQTLL